jgi:FixJ family two-component response regulator
MTPFLQYTPYHHRTSNMSKIIIVMAYGREEVMQKFQKAGAVDFLLKSEPVLAV